MLLKWGIMLQVVDTNVDGGLCLGDGALCFQWWIRTRGGGGSRLNFG